MKTNKNNNSLNLSANNVWLIRELNKEMGVRHITQQELIRELVRINGAKSKKKV